MCVVRLRTEGCDYVCHSRLPYVRLHVYVSTAYMTDMPEKLPSMAGANAGLTGTYRCIKERRSCIYGVYLSFT